MQKSENICGELFFGLRDINEWKLCKDYVLDKNI